MPSSPEPTSSFEVFGQALYAVDRVGSTPSGNIMVFAVSEASRKWLAWYQFNSMMAPDSVLLHAGHEVIGEGSASSSHFKTEKPINVEEFTGPIAYDRRNGQEQVGPRLSVATFSGRGKTIDVNLVISGVYRAPSIMSSLKMHIKANKPFGHENVQGYTIFLMSEPFAYPMPHLNVRERLRNVRRSTFA